LAWSGLADSYLLLSNYSRARSTETLPKARSSAEKAVALDPQLAEAHTSLAMVLRHQWQFEESEEEFRKAIELNPKYANAHQWYSLLLSELGKHEEAINEAKIAHSLEPLYLITNFRLGLAYKSARRDREAIEQAKRTVEIFPDSPLALVIFSGWLADEGKFSEAISHCKKAIQLDENPQCLGHIYARQGKKQEVEKLFKAKPVTSDWREFVRADTYSLLNEKDKAFEILEKLYEEKSPFLSDLKSNRNFDNLRNDPRYKEMVKRIGFPE